MSFYAMRGLGGLGDLGAASTQIALVGGKPAPPAPLLMPLVTPGRQTVTPGHQKLPRSDSQVAAQQISQWETGLVALTRPGLLGHEALVISRSFTSGLHRARNHWEPKRSQSDVHNRLFLAADRGHRLADNHRNVLVISQGKGGSGRAAHTHSYLEPSRQALAEFRNAAVALGRPEGVPARETQAPIKTWSSVTLSVPEDLPTSPAPTPRREQPRWLLPVIGIGLLAALLATRTYLIRS